MINVYAQNDCVKSPLWSKPPVDKPTVKPRSWTNLWSKPHHELTYGQNLAVDKPMVKNKL